MTTVRIGDTVRLTVTFVDWNGEAADVESPTFKVYDLNGTRQLLTTVNLTEANRTDVGQYYCDYVIPDSTNVLVCEFSGTSQGTVTLVRRELETIWV